MVEVRLSRDELHSRWKYMFLQQEESSMSKILWGRVTKVEESMQCPHVAGE